MKKLIHCPLAELTANSKDARRGKNLQSLIRAMRYHCGDTLTPQERTEKMGEMEINHLAVFVAALSDFAVGALWYSPLLFYKSWMKANGFTEEEVAGGNKAVIFSVTFILSLVISYNLAFFLADPETDLLWGLTAGLLAGAGWAAAAFAIVGLFEQRSLRYILINCGYIIVAFALKGLILGAWR